MPQRCPKPAAAGTNKREDFSFGFLGLQGPSSKVEARHTLSTKKAWIKIRPPRVGDQGRTRPGWVLRVGGGGRGWRRMRQGRCRGAMMVAAGAGGGVPLRGAPNRW